MNVLIDSHILFWSMQHPDRLRARERTLLASTEHSVFFSVSSVWELNIKHSKKKISLAPDFARSAVSQGFAPLPIHLDHVEVLRTLPLIHGDPFDRILAAQAIHENLVLMTRDRHLKSYPLTTF